MSDLPPGWAEMTVGEAGHVMLGRQRSPRYHSGPHMRPYLRVKNVFENRIDLLDVMEMDFSPADFDRYRLESGDILLNEGQSPELVGRPAMYRGELPGACFTNSLIRFRPREGVDGSYALYLFLHHLWSGRFRQEARITTNIAHLSAGRFITVEFPVPPLNEQRRIVAAIEEHLSRLDAASAALVAALQRLAGLHRATSTTSIGNNWPAERFGNVTVNFDGRRVPVKASDRAKKRGPYPYFGASGVIDGVDDFLFEGDYLLVAEDGANLISRAKPIAFRASGRFWVNNHAHVVQTMPGFEQRFLELVVNGADLSGLITGTAQPKLTQANLNKIIVPVPPIEEQRRIVAEVEERLSAIDALRAAIERAQRRSAALRRAVLERAFRGELVPQDPSDEPAEALLARIRAERDTSSSDNRRSRRRVRG